MPMLEMCYNNAMPLQHEIEEAFPELVSPVVILVGDLASPVVISAGDFQEPS
jgi:hypothetical protein